MATQSLVIAWALSAVFTASLTWSLLPPLRRLKGETVREDVPERHRLKAGTPTLGGLAFVIAVPLTTLLVAIAFGNPSLFPFALCGGTMLSFAVLGFADDWAKLRRRKGWRTQPKLAAQIALALLWVGLGWRLMPSPPLGLPSWFWFAFAVLLLLATVNGVNIADGLDGLAAGLTAIATMAVALIAHRQGHEEPALFALALCGGCFGFLLFNRYPAKVFMGDTGSMALGAGLGMAALLSGAILPFLVIGAVFWIEQLTVVVQVAYFKWTKRRFGEGRRLFPMTPIHHAFELRGWSEPMIVLVFWAAGLLAALVGISLR
jgi:phospho-N-acetylmuramoyl-pentapeptide-transferase